MTLWKVETGAIRASLPYQLGSRTCLLGCRVEHSCLYNYTGSFKQMIPLTSVLVDGIHYNQGKFSGAHGCHCHREDKSFCSVHPSLLIPSQHLTRFDVYLPSLRGQTPLSTSTRRWYRALAAATDHTGRVGPPEIDLKQRTTYLKTGMNGQSAPRVTLIQITGCEMGGATDAGQPRGANPEVFRLF